MSTWDRQARRDLAGYVELIDRFVGGRSTAGERTTALTTRKRRGHGHEPPETSFVLVESRLCPNYRRRTHSYD